MATNSPQLHAQYQKRKKTRAVWIILIVIMLFAAEFRFDDLDAKSLSQDESTMLHFTRGVLEKGYPYLVRGGSEVLMATYELVPYFIAPMVKVFGWSEKSVRLPAAIFGLATLLLIFVASKNWFGNRVALLASLLYAVSPWALYWSKNSFYPSQLQFFALLSVMLVYRLFHAEGVRNRDYYILAAVLSATYLTWEGSGLLFLVYGLLGLTLYWKQWGFMRHGHAWLAFGGLILVVIIQLLRRGLLKDPFLVIGSSRSSISAPQLALNQPTFDPYYYLDNIFASEQHIMLFAMFLLGVVFLRQDKNLRFVYGYVCFSLLIYTELLAVYAIRYLYFILPLFLIAASASTFKMLDWVTQAGTRPALKSIRALGLTCALIFIPFQVLVLSGDGISLSELRPGYRDSVAWELHPDVAEVDYRHVMLALGQKYRAGDIIILRSPFLLEAYTGLRGDYMLQSVTIGVVNYDSFLGPPYYLDKFVGNPVLRNRAELEDVLHRHSRVWFLATAVAPTKYALGDDLFAFVHETMTLVTEGSKVRLYLWEN